MLWDPYGTEKHDLWAECKASVCQSQNQSQSYITTDGQSTSLSWCQAPIWDQRPIFIFLSLIISRQLWVCWWGAPSLTRGRVCSFQLLLASPAESYLSLSPAGLMAIFYCLNIETPPNLAGQVPVFISHRNRVAQLHPQTLGLSNLFTYYSYYSLYLKFWMHIIYEYVHEVGWNQDGFMTMRLDGTKMDLWPWCWMEPRWIYGHEVGWNQDGFMTMRLDGTKMDLWLWGWMEPRWVYDHEVGWNQNGFMTVRLSGTEMGIPTRPLSVQAWYSRLCPLKISCGYNGSLVTWTVICLTADKFKPLTFQLQYVKGSWYI
jgi:hypothetical protein